MTTKSFSVVLEILEKLHSRNEISSKLSELFKELKKEEVEKVVYLLQGRVYPKYVPLEFNLANKQIINFLVGYFLLPESEVIEGFQRFGDLGNYIFSLSETKVSEVLKKFGQGDLVITEYYDLAKSITGISGKDSVKRKLELLKSIVFKLDPLSSKYFIRMLSGNLRLGLSDKTIIDSLSYFISNDKTYSEQIERGYGAISDLGKIATLVKEKGVEGVSDLKLIPGIPVASKLVEREKNVEAIWERMPNPLVQAKYDGLRCQLHLIDEKNIDKFIEENITKKEIPTQLSIVETNDTSKVEENKEMRRVRLFSRNQESLTDMFPDVSLTLSKIGVESIIMDSEVLGYDAKNDKFFPFQETMQRKRKYGILEKALSIPVKCMIFDILYLNGEDLTEKPLEERIEILEKVLKEFNKGNNDGILVCSKNIFANDTKEIQNIFDKYIDEGLEGIITKAKGTKYDPGTRNFDWIKLKRSSDSTLNDTIDAVVLGYYTGKGSRTEFGVGTILVGVYDKDSDSFKTLAKVGTGFTEEKLKEAYSDLEQIRIKECPKNVVIDSKLVPDVWVIPQIVCEIEADEITKSESHTANYSLRFPRIKKWGRDKGATETTSIKEIEEMFNIRKA
ncbi:MAG: ATP-dependent DNA ligase [bacterium]